MISTHLDFVSIHQHDIADIIIKKKDDDEKEGKQERLKEKFTKTNTDRYPGTRQLVSKLSASAR